MSQHEIHSGYAVREPSSIVIVGASGDLAQTKVLPALFSLYSQGFLPDETHVFGFARSALTDAAFRAKAREHLTCRYVPGESCEDYMQRFLSRCHYSSGAYESTDAFRALFALMKKVHGPGPVNTIFYLALPPSVFMAAARSIGDAAADECGPRRECVRLVIEKPFGRDRASSDVLAQGLGGLFAEDQIYRIDHYLGKEVVQNLMVLRFANRVFEPLWNSTHIRSVSITWKEDIGVGDRGGYFDDYGIIRDVMQNHLLQMMAVVAMEPPRDLNPDSVRDEKVKLLRSVVPLELADVVVGQYQAAERGGIRLPAYREEKHVTAGSRTPTYAAAVLRVRNARWAGIPFMVRAGKALDARLTEIRLRFRPLAWSIFPPPPSGATANELVIRVQPDEAIDFRIVNKVPGLTLQLAETELNLRYQSAFHGLIPDAYECLLLDVLRGDKSLFIRADELAAAWDIFTPVLHALEDQQVQPVPYTFGSADVPAAADLGRRWVMLNANTGGEL